MKKIFLTTVVALFSFAASAQFLVATELSKTDDGEGGESYSIEGLTNNMAFGYEVMDKIIIGITMKDATVNTEEVIGSAEQLAILLGDELSPANGGLDGILGDDPLTTTIDESADDVAAVLAAAGDVREYAAATDSVSFKENGTVVADMQIFVRYAISDDMYLQVTTPMSTEEGYNGNDHMRIGAGYSFNVWGDVNAEFNYSLKVNGGDDGDRGGQMGIGVSLNF